MKNVRIYNIKTERLELKVPTIEEQYTLWSILKKPEINKLYFPTPNRIYKKYELDKSILSDQIKARKLFQKELDSWDKQKPFYESKVNSYLESGPSTRFEWSIFLNDVCIGQCSCQNGETDNPDYRDVGWFIDEPYFGQGYTTEAARAMLNFMFDEAGIKEINTSAAKCNPGSWKIMEKLGMEYVGEKPSEYLDENGNVLTAVCYKLNKTMHK